LSGAGREHQSVDTATTSEQVSPEIGSDNEGSLEKDVLAQSEDSLSHMMVLPQSLMMVYFYPLLGTAADLEGATWEELRSAYKEFPNLSSQMGEVIVFFVEPDYEVPNDTSGMDFMKYIPYAEFAKLNPNAEGWMFSRLVGDRVRLCKGFGEEAPERWLSWDEFETEFPKAMILSAWSYLDVQPGQVLVAGYDLSGRRGSHITFGIDVSAVDIDRIVGVAVTRHGGYEVSIDRDDIEEELAGVQAAESREESGEH